LAPRPRCALEGKIRGQIPQLFAVLTTASRFISAFRDWRRLCVGLCGSLCICLEHGEEPKAQRRSRLCSQIANPSYNESCRRSEYSLTESAVSPFQAEPTHTVGRPTQIDQSLTRITPTATPRRSRSGSFKRAFSASAFVLNGFDNGVSRPSMYLKSSHFKMILGI
jgi:hypothetical protein